MAISKAKNTATYFPHWATDDRARQILQAKHGLTGYAVYYKVFELLCREHNHFFDCNSEGAWEYLTSISLVDKDELEKILDLLARLGVTDKHLWESHRVIWSAELLGSIKDVYTRNRHRAVPPMPRVDGCEVCENQDYSEDYLDRSDVVDTLLRHDKVESVF